MAGDPLGLEQRLLNVAEREIAKQGFIITKGSEDNLRKSMRKAIANMYLSNHANDPLHIALAEAILTQVAIRMMIDARNANKNTLHEDSLPKVEAEFISRWPWTNRY
jgi:hypothetical protein